MADPHRTAAPPPKATLFCQRCGHASGVDGDWRVRERRGAVEYVCPACGRTLTRRSAADDPDRRRPLSTR